LQPIVENAIDHGLFHKAGKGFLKIEFEKGHSPNEIHCIIDDDGIGRENAKLLARQSLIKTESYGERLIEDLVSIFNKYEKINISIRYIDKAPPLTGTTVIIKIKYPINER
jgi:LytS/YehU family sensor histidine kinase